MSRPWSLLGSPLHYQELVHRRHAVSTGSSAVPRARALSEPQQAQCNPVAAGKTQDSQSSVNFRSKSNNPKAWEIH